MPARAIILIAHGSPDPDWAKPLRSVVDAMRARSPTTAVELALLTDADSLGAAIAKMKADGHRRIEVVAALLSAGGRHLKKDIPEWVAAARLEHADVELQLRPGALGADPAVIAMIAQVALDG